MTVEEEDDESYCFICYDGGDSVQKCSQGRCPKYYHSACGNFKADSEWICDRHFCTSCGKKSVIRCLMCINALCGAHKKEEGDNWLKVPGRRWNAICSTCLALLRKCAEQEKRGIDDPNGLFWDYYLVYVLDKLPKDVRMNIFGRLLPEDEERDNPPEPTVINLDENSEESNGEKPRESGDKIEGEKIAEENVVKEVGDEQKNEEKEEDDKEEKKGEKKGKEDEDFEVHNEEEEQEEEEEEEEEGEEKGKVQAKSGGKLSKGSYNEVMAKGRRRRSKKEIEAEKMREAKEKALELSHHQFIAITVKSMELLTVKLSQIAQIFQEENSVEILRGLIEGAFVKVETEPPAGADMASIGAEGVWGIYSEEEIGKYYKLGRICGVVEENEENLNDSPKTSLEFIVEFGEGPSRQKLTSISNESPTETECDSLWERMKMGKMPRVTLFDALGVAKKLWEYFTFNPALNQEIERCQNIRNSANDMGKRKQISEMDKKLKILKSEGYRNEEFEKNFKFLVDPNLEEIIENYDITHRQKSQEEMIENGSVEITPPPPPNRVSNSRDSNRDEGGDFRGSWRPDNSTRPNNFSERNYEYEPSRPRDGRDFRDRGRVDQYRGESSRSRGGYERSSRDWGNRGDAGDSNGERGIRGGFRKDFRGNKGGYRGGYKGNRGGSRGGFKGDFRGERDSRTPERRSRSPRDQWGSNNGGEVRREGSFNNGREGRSSQERQNFSEPQTSRGGSFSHSPIRDFPGSDVGRNQVESQPIQVEIGPGNQETNVSGGFSFWEDAALDETLAGNQGITGGNSARVDTQENVVLGGNKGNSLNSGGGLWEDASLDETLAGNQGINTNFGFGGREDPRKKGSETVSVVLNQRANRSEVDDSLVRNGPKRVRFQVNEASNDNNWIRSSKPLTPKEGKQGGTRYVTFSLAWSGVPADVEEWMFRDPFGDVMGPLKLISIKECVEKDFLDLKFEIWSQWRSEIEAVKLDDIFDVHLNNN